MIGMSHIQQSAALPYRMVKGRLQVLLITSLTTKRWIIPKGNVEPGLTARESAEYEAFEEAGVTGTTASASIGTYTYRQNPKKGRAPCRVRVYPIRVGRELDKYPDAKKRTRRWVSIEEAAAMASDAGLRSLLLKFEKRVAAVPDR